MDPIEIKVNFRALWTKSRKISKKKMREVMKQVAAHVRLSLANHEWLLSGYFPLTNQEVLDEMRIIRPDLFRKRPAKILRAKGR